MSLSRDSFLRQVLDLMESREMRLLAWGIVDAYFSKDELYDLIDEQLEAALKSGFEEFLAARDVVAALLQLMWISTAEGPNGDLGYRSRMAETLRLVARLRQLFPKHSGDTGWQSAPTLVADFRFLRRPRQFPDRTIPAKDALHVLRAVTSSPALLKAARAMMLAPDGTEMILGGFQVRAAERIIRGIETNTPLATIVCAGTGSGKTLAFYLPALASVARHVLTNTSPKAWVKAIALYPRVELLKDQLREVMSRTLDLARVLDVPVNKFIRVGAYFSDTPSSAKYCSWTKVGQDRICPMLNCLKCGGELRWCAADIQAGRERLVCVACDFELDGEVFPLTREAMRKRVPDVLFTTTEMLNQRLSDSSSSHLFGVGSKAIRAPELVLLDEVHTYEGQHGAQVAYLLRRWQKLLDQPLRFVGLSATLREASTFFVALTGCRHSLVEEVSPQNSEIKSEGVEYLLAIRGDPVSRAALMSTTIQTTMLLQRCLDPHSETMAESLSHGLFGQKTFVFTDNLDVINRLYFDLLSAEGRNSYGDPDMRNAPNGGLAVLRKQGASNFRYLNGQDWRACEVLQGPLERRLAVKRVSSQDRGVDRDADVVVATAVLEVGFDDPSVGAVVQHKAPRGIASFMQRKGRAGRSKVMRPWTAVVLSDYGRDRLAYQTYDLLFDPELPVRTLPLGNRYIMRMQAVYATIDYLSVRLQDASVGSVWRDLSEPGAFEARRDRLMRELEIILSSELGTTRLARHLQYALKIEPKEVSALLWEYPRPLMTSVLPTALRRLASGWSAHKQPKADFIIANNPLPDFIPASLFSDLSLAEVIVELPGADSTSRFDQPAMSIFAALREFAPGRVSRRYGVRYRTERHWLPPSAQFGEEGHSGETVADLDIASCGRQVFIGEYLLRENDAVVPVPVYRPVSMVVAAPPKNVKDSSNASLRWHTQLVPRIDPTWLSPPQGGIWPELVPKIGFFTHSRHAAVEVRRFSTGAESEIGVGRDKVRMRTNFTREGAAIGLGATFAADGVVFQLNIPEALHARHASGSKKKWRALRTARFTDMAWRGVSLAMVDNPFAREWLAQVFMSALFFESLAGNRDLAGAARSLREGTAAITLPEVLGRMFQSQIVANAENETSNGPEDKLRQDLDALLKIPAVVDELHHFAAVLWDPIGEEWEPWLRAVYQATLAAALLRSITDLSPTIDPDDLSVDLDRGPTEGETSAPSLSEIWLIEKTPGGSGLVEQVMSTYAEDPRRFFSTVRANLQMSEFEQIDHQLGGLVRMLARDEETESVKLIREYRSSGQHADKTRIIAELRRALLLDGFSPFHGFFVSMGSRILRLGMGPASDQYMNNVLQRWDAEEERLGVEIDLRIMCYFLSQTDDIDRVVAEIGSIGGTDREAWRVGAIYGLLWARGKAVRQTALQLRNPFTEMPMIERLLVDETLVDERVRVPVAAHDWFEQAATHLAAGRLVTLTSGGAEWQKLADALDNLVTNAIDAGYLRAYARLQGVRRHGDTFEADLELLEALQ
jgi:hypothetical protein